MPNTPLKGDYNTYIGARYVPIIGGMWNQQTEYEPLTIVMYQGSSFTSKTFVPKGTQIDNTTYWVRTANYDEQVEFYRSEVQQFKKDIDASEAQYIATVQKAQSEYEASITKRQNDYEDNLTVRQNEYEASLQGQITTLRGNIDAEASTRASADSNLQSQIDQIIAPSGEAPSAAEVQNARIGADGVTYDTLGNAIRGQVGNLKSALESNEAVCMVCKNGIGFDTTAKTVTISTPIYLYIGKKRYIFESDNVVLNYNVSGSDEKMFILRNGAFTIIPYTQFDVTTDTAIWTFSAENIANPSTNNIYQPYFVDGEWIRPQKNLTKSTGIIQSANTLLNVPNGIWFDTVNGQIVFKKAFYVTIGTVRHDYESNDVIVSYSGISGNTVMLVYDKTEGLKCISLDNWNVYDQTPIFTFQKNGLTNIKTNNIFYPYYVDGMLFNEERKYALVDGATGDDTNPGTYTLPFKTIQKGIDSNARYIFVARGTYNENINITSKKNMQIIPYSTPIFSTSAFDVPMIIVNSVNISSSYDVLLRDIHANNPASDSGSWVINNSYNIVFDHCWASNGEGGGFVATNLYGRFIQCKAWDIGDSSHYNSDGFNFHGYGATELTDCIAHDCYDDGISHHDGCVATIKGGEFWNCTHGGGIAPVNRYTEIDGAYCHDNAWGLQAKQVDVTLYDPYILVKNSVLKNNAQKDISIGEIPCKVLRCTFDTKDIPEGAQYVEIN